MYICFTHTWLYKLHTEICVYTHMLRVLCTDRGFFFGALIPLKLCKRIRALQRYRQLCHHGTEGPKNSEHKHLPARWYSNMQYGLRIEPHATPLTLEAIGRHACAQSLNTFYTASVLYPCWWIPSLPALLTHRAEHSKHVGRNKPHYKKQ